MEYKINYNEIEDVVKNVMGNDFDSHKLIEKFILNYPASYGSLLIKHNNVATAHSEISNFLRNHADKLEIEKVGSDKVSKDIFGNDVTNADWKKK